MFDPTAFDNMKVVLEGAIYDLDFAGEIKIVNRDDLVNLAKLSRQYCISFETLPTSLVTATIILRAGLENFADELLPGIKNNELMGAHVQVQFLLKQCFKQSGQFTELDQLIQTIWGENRHVSYQLMSNPLNDVELPTCQITLSFNRLILEENMDDLKEMAVYMVETANKLEQFLATLDF